MNTGGSLEWVDLIHYQWTADGLLYDTQPFYGYFGVTGNAFWSGGPNGAWENPPAWPFLPKSLQVTYSHGYSIPGSEAQAPDGVPPLPNGVVSAVIRGAAVYLENPNSSTDVGIGDVRYKFDPSGPAGWLDEKLLGQFRLVHL